MFAESRSMHSLNLISSSAPQGPGAHDEPHLVIYIPQTAKIPKFPLPKGRAGVAALTTGIEEML
jgi:hypothetical protein